MASRYWVGGTATWDGTAGSKWAATSGGAGGQTVPTNADDVFFDASSSGTVTLSSSSVASSINCTGFTGTISHPAAVNLAIGGSSAGASNIALKLVAGMTYTLGSATTSTHSFVSTSATQQTIDFGGKTMAALTFNGAGGSWQLISTLTTSQANSANTLTLTAGSLDTNGQTITVGRVVITGTSTRSLTLGASSISANQNGSTVWDATTTTNLTFNAGTSSIAVGNANTTFAGGGLTYYDITISHNSGGSFSITGGNTFRNFTSQNSSNNTRLVIGSNMTITGTLNLTGTSATNTGFVLSTVRGSAITLTVAAIGTINNINLQDITTAGAAGTWNLSAQNVGNMGGNTGITFPSSVTRYWVGVTGGNWSSTANWSTSSGGGTGASIPLAHDTAVFDSNSITSGGRTITINAQCVPTLDFTNVTNSPTIAQTVSNGIIYVAGSLTYASGLTISGTTTVTLHGRSASTIRTNGCTVTNILNFENAGSTCTLQDALTTTNIIQHRYGTLDTNGQSVSCTVFDSNTSTTRTITLGASTITLTSTGTVWNCGTSTNLTINAGTSNISITDTSSTSKTFAGGARSYNTVTIAPGGTGAVIFNGSGTTISTLALSNGPKTITFNSSITYNIGTFAVYGSSGNVVTLNSATPGSRHTLSSTSGVISTDYLSIQDSLVTGGAAWYAGANSTNVSNNSGWIFTAVPTTTTSFLQFF